MNEWKLIFAVVAGVVILSALTTIWGLMIALTWRWVAGV